MRPRARAAGVLLAFLSVAAAAPAGAWPTSLQKCLLRDARRLVPRSLARLIGEREDEVLEQAARFPAPLGQALATDLATGTLQAATLEGLESHAAAALELFRQHRVSEGIVLLGATLRIPGDLADPVLTGGADGYPAGVAREYYAFIEMSLDKLPVTLDEEAALKLERRALPGYWRSLLERSRAQAPVLRTELFQRGRVVDHRSIDYRSPVFGVAQISYSRAVTGIAATWRAIWQEARGDLTRQPAPTLVEPKDAPPLEAP